MPFNPIKKIIERKQSLALLCMLETLHFSIWLDFGSLFSRAFLLVHAGLFLIWQPIWRRDENLAWKNSLLLVSVILVAIYWLNFWILFVWLILLIGFISGKAAMARSERILYIIIIVFLVSQLLLGCVVMIADTKTGIEWIFRAFLPALPFIIFFLPASAHGQYTQYSVDLINAISASTLASVVALGSLLNMFLSNAPYILALIQTSLVVGFCIICISYFLTLKSSYNAVAQLWLDSLLNTGTPFELWFAALSRHAETEQTADRFVEATMKELLVFDWIAGASWVTDTSEGMVGVKTYYLLQLADHKLKVKLFTYEPVGGALRLHCNLLIKLMRHFYMAKLHERELTKRVHLAAIHEMGARITHDIKNLLQSLYAITDIAAQDSSAAAKSLRHQLPILNKRLQFTLDKLQTVRFEPDAISVIPLMDWWAQTQYRIPVKNIVFTSEYDSDPLIPADLFDSFFENMLENFQKKKSLERGIQAQFELHCRAHTICCRFSDNGSAIPEAVAALILREPVDSDYGLGVGLYQTARQARAVQYTLSLRENSTGCVCFELHNMRRDQGDIAPSA